MPDTWGIRHSDDFERSFRRLRKRWPGGADALLARLQNFLDRWLNNPQLSAGFHLPGWIHPEGRGVLAVDQGTKGNLPALRLYLWLDHRDRLIWLLCAGDKRTQYADIAYCHDWVNRFASRDGSADDQS